MAARWLFFAGTLAVTAGVLLGGCDNARPPFNTAPLGGKDVAVTIDPSDVLNDPLSRTLPAVAATARLGDPLTGLSAAHRADFEEGKEDFEEVETIEEGLGPVFNEAACVTCHTAPVGGTNGRIETRFGRRDNGRFDALAGLGGSLIQDKAIGKVSTSKGRFTYVAEVVPRGANVRAGRITTPLFGLGLVDAVTDDYLLALARFQARNTPSTRGTPHMVVDVASGQTRVGRFGFKSQVATLATFSGDAYLNEMGITSPLFPNENAPQGDARALRFNPLPTVNDDGSGLEAFEDFMTLLGPPPRGARTRQTDEGATVFGKIGCANCHVQTLVTGESEIPALSKKTFQPFSDFLLHDMGRLGDGIVQGNARGRDFRTTPLWGLRTRTLLLHDGRARTLENAILEHDGQGAEARRRFTGLSRTDRSALIAFLRSL
jgi:CxxC motif-containing protein (DUF1111 family)